MFISTLCCDGCLPDSTTTTWHRGEYNSTKASPQTPPPSDSFQKITSNRNNQHRNPTITHTKIQTHQPLTLPLQLTVPNSPRTVSTVPVYVQNTVQQRLKQSQIQKLQRQNQYYLSIINNELVPLKRDYNNLKREYERSMQLVSIMDQRLKGIERMYYAPSKSMFNSQITRI